MMRIAAFAIAGLSLCGCALVEDAVPVTYSAPANISVVEGAKAVTLGVKTQDGRVSNRDRISTKKNGYGVEMAKITASNDVVAEVGKAVETELSSLGFTIGANGITVNVETTTFYNDFKLGFWSGDAVAEVAFNLTAKKPNGELVYSHGYRAVGMNKNIMISSGGMAQPALQEALRNAVQEVVQDKDLHQALLKAGSTLKGAPTS
jgi:uncharacterized lipoprotein YajG